MPEENDQVEVRETAPCSRLLWRWGFRRPLGSRQFRLVTLFILVAVVSVGLGLLKRWYDGQAPYRRLRAAGAQIQFHDNPRRVVVDFSGAAVSDRDLEHLCAVPLAMSVDLSGTAVTDDAIAHLIRAPQLERVNLNRTNVSPAAILRLCAVRPDVKLGAFKRTSYLAW
jgi:hypothetical protein